MKKYLLTSSLLVLLLSSCGSSKFDAEYYKGKLTIDTSSLVSSSGSNKIIKEINKNKDALFIINEIDFNKDSQIDYQAIQYVKDHGKKISSIDFYDVYSFK